MYSYHAIYKVYITTYLFCLIISSLNYEMHTTLSRSSCLDRGGTVFGVFHDKGVKVKRILCSCHLILIGNVINPFIIFIYD